MSRRRKIYVIAALLLAAGFIVNGVGGGGNNSPLYDLALVERRDLVSEVSVTGRVKPAESVDLAFERSGKVGSVGVAVGNQVATGQTLVRLINTELAANYSRSLAGVESARALLAQYQAAVERERARLEELQRGARLEEVALAQTKVDNARQAVADAERNLEQTTNKAAIDLVNNYEAIRDLLRDAYAKADDAVNRQTDLLFDDDASVAPRLSFVTIHSSARLAAESQRVEAGRTLSALRELQTIQSLSLTALEEALRADKKHLTAIAQFLQSANDAILDAVGASAVTIETYRTSVTLGLSNVNAALAGLNTQEQKIAAQKVTSQNSLVAAEARLNDAKSALEAVEAELTVKRSPASPQELAAQQAAIRQAEANVTSQRARIREAAAAAEAAAAQLEDTFLRAPFGGIITKQEARVGEIIAPNEPLISLIAEEKFEIEANLPEADIAKIALQNPADITLDAYGDDAHWSATIIEIEPAETIVEGVPTYKIRLQFGEKDERIKSGMTANIVIAAGKRENVLVVPGRAIIESDSQKSVRVLRGEGRKQRVESVPVTVGLRGSDGGVEILSGLQEGEQVVVGEKESR